MQNPLRIHPQFFWLRPCQHVLYSARMCRPTFIRPVITLRGSSKHRGSPQIDKAIRVGIRMTGLRNITKQRANSVKCGRPRLTLVHRFQLLQ